MSYTNRMFLSYLRNSDIVAASIYSDARRCHQGPGVIFCSPILSVLALFSNSCLMATRWLFQRDVWAMGVMLTSGQEEGKMSKGLFPLLSLFMHQGKPLIMLH